MKKIRNTIISFFIVFFSINSNSYSEVVNKVQVEGNSRITLETIKIFGDIVEGRDYDSSGINLIIKKLYDSTFFSNIVSHTTSTPPPIKHTTLDESPDPV